ncbi:MAG: 4Fe-4S binding protein [Gammaproteobacteria bacterium]|nr:4Fe-4S binding protein [Gammaproteobacteria bacterium]
MNTVSEELALRTTVSPEPHAVRRSWAIGLARLGDAMQRHRGAIQAIQWTIVLLYAVLLIVPAVLPLPASGATILSNLTLLAQFAFWGIWWPFVILSVVLLGRMWCGVFCPEGALTEFASRHGLGRAIPHWMRWGGWPFVAFGCTTIYGQLISVYEYPKATLLILGGSTVAAVGIGLVYGRGSRLWCRYLCPVNGVFALLARIAPVHFNVDRDAWRRDPARSSRIDCAPLIDVRHMRSAAQCHACGRCSGHRGAVTLALRNPNSEVLATRPGQIGTPIALLLIFGLLGIAPGAFQWTVSPWFVGLRQRAAEWLINHDSYALLASNAPWWVLTHYPAASDVFTWLDGLLIVGYIAAYALLAGGIIWLALRAAQRVAGTASFDWRSLALGLIPIAGAGLFLGLSMLTLTQLRAEGWTPPGVGIARALIVAGALLWSAWLGARIVVRSPAAPYRRIAALLLYLVPLSVAGTDWYLMFRLW